MSIDDADGEDYPPPGGRRSFTIAMARMEAKLDVAIAQHQARLDEHSRRLHDLSLVQAELAHRVGKVEQSQAAAEAVESKKPAPQPVIAYISIGITLLLGVLYLIQNYGA
jgi:hypothetical protein